MSEFSTIITYIFLFSSLYFEVFMLVTYLENRTEIQKHTEGVPDLKAYPKVSVIVPCWNEQNTVAKTVNSLLALNYPKDKVEVIVIDDGSTDGTWQAMQAFKNNPQVKLFQKMNGGKHTALNLGIENSSGEIIGCLDADSFVEPDALSHIVLGFEKDQTLSAVTPSVKISKPKTLMQVVQHVEYTWAIFLRNMLARVNAMYVTPGPFSFFKREVFQSIGGYRKAHMTEDMELAMRMQKNHLKIGNAYRAAVYTNGPENLKKLYRQRVRWTYGFMKNAVDYREMFFKTKYGNLGLFVLPIACLSIFVTLYGVSTVLINWASQIINLITRIRTVGFHINFTGFNFDWFYVNTEIITVASIAALIGMITILLLSKKMARANMRYGVDLLYFLALYSFIAPIWMFKAVYNVIFSVTTSWR